MYFRFPYKSRERAELQVVGCWNNVSGPIANVDDEVPCVAARHACIRLQHFHFWAGSAAQIFDRSGSPSKCMAYSAK
jgi:hypothetical protein